MKIFRTGLFSNSIRKLGASEAELDALESAIEVNPESGDMIPGLRGVRKIRFRLKGKGKSGGGRCIYLALVMENAVYLLLAYDKSVQADISAAKARSGRNRDASA